MATGDIKDPYGNYNFLVELDGVSRGAFQECSGFDSTIDVTEYAEGAHNTLRKLPGMTKYNNITLKWGITDDTVLYDWHQKIVNGDIERKNGSIVMLDRKGEEVVRWNFERAWPTKWDGPDLNAEGNDVGIEMIEIVVEYIVRV